jgi:hypothetical protein
LKVVGSLSDEEALTAVVVVAAVSDIEGHAELLGQWL